MTGDFIECDTCRDKPGGPTLCRGCQHNRSLIDRLQLALQGENRLRMNTEQLRDVYQVERGDLQKELRHWRGVLHVSEEARVRLARDLEIAITALEAIRRLSEDDDSGDPWQSSNDIATGALDAIKTKLPRKVL